MNLEKNNSGPTVSVIIPVFNREKFIEGTLKSVFEQTFNDYEIVCIDDGSTDGTARVLSRFKDKIVYLYQENSGIAAARNAGIKVSRGKYVAFLDADDLWDQEKLQVQVDYLNSHPDAAMVHSNTRIVKDGSVLYDKLNIASRHKGGDIFQELYLGNFINTLTVMVRREALEKSGYFDGQFKNSQDYDMWLRLAAISRIGYQDVVLGTYVVHEGNVSADRIQVLKDQIGIMEKAERIHGELVRTIPRKKLNRRLYEKNFSLGYAYFCQQDMGKSRKYFRDATRYRKMSARPYMYIWSSYFGKNFIGLVRSVRGACRASKADNQKRTVALWQK